MGARPGCLILRSAATNELDKFQSPWHTVEMDALAIRGVITMRSVHWAWFCLGVLIGRLLSEQVLARQPNCSRSGFITRCSQIGESSL